MKPGNNVRPVASKISARGGTFVDSRLPAAAILSPRTTTTAFETGDPPLPSISVAPTMATMRLVPAAGGLISRTILAADDGQTARKTAIRIAVGATKEVFIDCVATIARRSRSGQSDLT